MKVLIRDTEILTEPFSAWVQDHLDWMVTARPDGDNYALAEDAPADSIPSDFDIVEYYDTIREATEDEPAEVVTRRQAILNTARYEARKAQEVGEADPAPIEVPVAEESASGEPPATIVVDGIEYVRQ